MTKSLADLQPMWERIMRLDAQLRAAKAEFAAALQDTPPPDPPASPRGLRGRHSTVELLRLLTLAGPEGASGRTLRAQLGVTKAYFYTMVYRLSEAGRIQAAYDTNRRSEARYSIIPQGPQP